MSPCQVTGQDLLVGVSALVAPVSGSVADAVVRDWGFRCRMWMKYSSGKSVLSPSEVLGDVQSLDRQ